MLVRVAAALEELGTNAQDLERMGDHELAETFLEYGWISGIGKKAAALAYSDIVMHIDGGSEVYFLIVQAADRLGKIVGRETLDSQDVMEIQEMLEGGNSVEQVRNRFVRSRTPA